MQNLINMIIVECMLVKEKARVALTNERGEANIIAIILVLAIVIALAVVFRSSLTTLFNKIWNSFTGNVNSVITN